MSTAKLFDFNAARERRSNRMENQKSGYVPLYRSILKKPWAKDVYLRALWENLLFAAQRQPYTAHFKGHTWPLDVGQLVTTPADLGLGLCDRNGKPASRDAVVRMLAVFAKEGMISMEGEKQKGTVITILNYAEYAEKTSDLPAHTSAHAPAHGEASAGAASRGGAAQGAAHEPAQHEQEYKNKNKNIPPKSPGGESIGFDPLAVEIPEWLSPNAWAEWVQYRQQSKKPIKTAMTVTKAFNLLKECFDEGHDPADVINTSIANSYQGLFKPKGPPKRPRPDEDSPHWNSREGWKDFL